MIGLQKRTFFRTDPQPFTHRRVAAVPVGKTGSDNLRSDVPNIHRVTQTEPPSKAECRSAVRVSVNTGSMTSVSATFGAFARTLRDNMRCTQVIPRAHLVQGQIVKADIPW